MKRAKKRSVTSLRPHSPRRRRRGFTLIELLITVAMIGVLAAIGIVGYRKYVHSAQSSEAKSMIAMIRGAEETFKGDFLVYLNVSTDINTFYPNPTPDDSKWSWVRPNDTAYTTTVAPCGASNQGMCGGWSNLNISSDAPVRFGYAVVAGVGTGNTITAPSKLVPPPTMPSVAAGVPWYTVQAVNKHNPSALSFAVFASSSVSAEILSQNEQE
jgi:type IV pilus assembly protein PilA